jgi:hypothetical protein
MTDRNPGIEARLERIERELTALRAEIREGNASLEAIGLMLGLLLEGDGTKSVPMPDDLARILKEHGRN